MDDAYIYYDNGTPDVANHDYPSRLPDVHAVLFLNLL